MFASEILILSPKFLFISKTVDIRYFPVTIKTARDPRVIPFSRNFLSKHPGVGVRCRHDGVEAITEARWKERGRKKDGRVESKKKVGKRKREFSDPLLLFTLSKSREPLSHRLLDACKYPWQRGTTMRSNPVANSERISGWSVSLRDRAEKREISFWSVRYTPLSILCNFLIDSFICWTFFVYPYPILLCIPLDPWMNIFFYRMLRFTRYKFIHWQTLSRVLFFFPWNIELALECILMLEINKQSA